MDAVDRARWRSAWVPSGKEKWLRATRIWGETVDEVPACGVRLRVVSVAAR